MIITVKEHPEHDKTACSSLEIDADEVTKALNWLEQSTGASINTVTHEWSLDYPETVQDSLMQLLRESDGMSIEQVNIFMNNVDRYIEDNKLITPITKFAHKLLDQTVYKLKPEHLILLSMYVLVRRDGFTDGVIED